MIVTDNRKERGDTSGIEAWTDITKMPPVNIEFKNLTCTLPIDRKRNKKILKGIDGQFRSGELTGIMGPSGAGKSTLLNILTGYKSDGMSGSVRINGQPRDMQSFRKMACYVMQDNLLQPNVTVLEAMHFAADLKLGFSVTKSAKQDIIMSILRTLRLIHAQNTMSDRLSGGEGKRLSIALELVNNPPVIILDEPTTGLDELSSAQCIDLLQKVALSGRTVICSIHTPSAKIFEKFHNIYVVADGRCTYRGPPSSLVNFLSSTGIDCPKHYNPADFVIDVSSGEYGHENVDKIVTEVEKNYPIISIKSTFTQVFKKNIKIPWHVQFFIILKRIMLQFIRDRNYFFVKTVMYAFCGVVAGTMFLNFGSDGSKTISNINFFFATLLLLFYVPMVPVLLQFPSSLKVIEREHFNRWYDLGPYYWALNVSTIPVQIFLCSIYVNLVYLLTGQPLEFYRYAMFSSTCLLASFLSEGLGFALGSNLSVVNGIFVGSVLHILMNLIAMQGLGDKTALSIQRRFLMRASYVKYGMEGLMISAYGYDRELLPCPDDYCHYRIPKEILQITQTENSFLLSIGVLIFYMISIRILAFYLVQRKFLRRINSSNHKTKNLRKYKNFG